MREDTLYEAVGGRPFFDRLVEDFYEGVEAEPLLRPMYPEDLTEPKAHLAGFLAQYWGGGSEQYSDERGHPRLRMRHAPFEIGDLERDAWRRCMDAALDRADLPPELDGPFREYVAMAADHLRNR